MTKLQAMLWSGVYLNYDDGKEEEELIIIWEDVVLHILTLWRY